ncbi:hypothetical protein [Burkholderia sp. LMG 32019]|uniref:hypothetical protein n=1 Tax=Burkholderia sp. LMG 32019 TaxID=3158173 RepID=UPI003C2E4656
MNFSLVEPTDLRDVAKANGWTLIEEAISDRLYVMENPAHSRRQLVFPMETSVRDYAESMQLAMETFAQLQRVELRQLFAEVLSARDDVLRYRITADSRTDEGIPLTFAESMLSGASMLLLASAHTVLRPRAHHPRLTRTEAQRLVEHSRFRHTQHGSFVLSVSSPVGLDVQVPLPLEGANSRPFVRQATLAARQSLQQLVQAIEADRLDDFVESQKTGTPSVSSNLCEAVGRLYDEDLENNIDIVFSWAPVLPLEPQERGRDVLRIQRDYFPRIEEVRRELRSVETPRTESFVGTVERLGGELGPDGLRSGEVVLSLLLPEEGQSVAARVTLDSTQYQQAIQAHSSGSAYVQVHGTLHPGRAPRVLSNVERFNVLRLAS